MSKHFGKTWWGQAFLNSLSNIDYSNRLPRGSAYARNGSVSQITIDGNCIQAKVKGSQPRPYSVTIIIPPFFEADVKLLTAAIADKPSIISKLLNRELDPEIMQIAEQLGLKIFPKQWTDFKMQCSCPDWAVPCKHLAAIIYKVSSEIDNNPFLAFELHKLDLPLELKKQKIFIEQSGNSEVPELASLLGRGFAKQKLAEVDKVAVKPALQPEPVLNFSGLPDLTEALIQLLPEGPAFYSQTGNFREKYAGALKKTARNAQLVLSGRVALETFFKGMGELKEDASAIFNHHTLAFVVLDSENKAHFHLGGRKKAGPTTAAIVSGLWQIPSSRTGDFQPEVAALRTALLMALNLMSKGLIIPQFIRLDSGMHAVRWLPAVLSAEVATLVEKLEYALPEALLRLSDSENISSQRGLHLVSIFLTPLVTALSESKRGDLFLEIFFSNTQQAFLAPGERSIPGAISNWVQRYYLTQGKYRPALLVEEFGNDNFLILIHIEEEGKDQDDSIPLGDVLALREYAAIKFDVLQSLSQISALIPGIDAHINAKGDSDLILSLKEFTPFLIQAVPALQLLNIHMLLPKSLEEILKPKASVHIKQKQTDTRGFIRIDKLLDFDWQVAIGDTILGEEEFNRLLKNSEGLIKYKKQYIYVSPSDLEKLHRHFASSKSLSSFEMLRVALGNDYFGAPVLLSEGVRALITQLTQQEEIILPNGLSAKLRPYQHRGFSWLYRNTRIGFGSVLADDMGLGKTLQVIALLLKFKEEGFLEKEKALIVVPTGLLTNWQAELEKFAPGLNYKVYHGSERTLEQQENYDVLLTSYGIARSEAAKLKKISWHVLAIDEAQNVKNHETGQSKALKSIPANTFIAMSGTPVENRLSELWSIMDFCNRGFLGTLSDFRESFANPIQNQQDLRAAGKLKAVTSPFLMRRLKSDKSIISDLPDKIEMNAFANLVPSQASLYEKTLHEAMTAIEGIESTGPKNLFVRQGLVLQMILALKQICNHPTQFLKNKVMDASLSGKMDLLFEKLETIIDAGEKVLIFTQFTEMGTLMQHFIQEHFNQAPLFYHGACTLKQRKEMVEAFQTNRADKIFVLSLKAAGTGLNLTAANHVIHYDLWWNPAVEAQATDRAYRIGQKSNVMVHRFITRGTFEEKIDEMIQSKKELANLTVATGESWIGNLSNKELKDLFELS